MDILDALDEMRAQNSRHEKVKDASLSTRHMWTALQHDGSYHLGLWLNQVDVDAVLAARRNPGISKRDDDEAVAKAKADDAADEAAAKAMFAGKPGGKTAGSGGGGGGDDSSSASSDDEEKKKGGAAAGKKRSGGGFGSLATLPKVRERSFTVLPPWPSIPWLSIHCRRLFTAVPVVFTAFPCLPTVFLVFSLPCTASPCASTAFQSFHCLRNTLSSTAHNSARLSAAAGSAARPARQRKSRLWLRAGSVFRRRWW